MSNTLEYAEKVVLEEIFGMSSGYFLSLSNKDFSELFGSVLGIDIYSENYATKGQSKAARMRAFWSTHPDAHISSILSTVGDAFLEGKADKAADSLRLKKIIKRLNGTKDTIQVTKDDVDAIWIPHKARLFISHRDSHKMVATNLSKKLLGFGISCFVAHESITPNSKWRDELKKGLQTMDALLILLSKDYFSSVWTNQEIGFAISRGVPLFIYSIDGTAPDGFLMDIQAAKGAEDLLVVEIRKGLQEHPAIKSCALSEFRDAAVGSFQGAKVAFMDLMDFDFDDNEIDLIVESIVSKVKNNQFRCLLIDPILKEHSGHREVRGLKFYRDALWTNILSKHTKLRYKIAVKSDWDARIVDGDTEL